MICIREKDKKINKMSSSIKAIINRKVVGELTFYKFKDNDKEATIKFIEILEEYRGKGIGTYLLWKFYDYVITFDKLRFVLWDDCSDNCRVIKSNIYVNVGAKYVDTYGPEMKWRIRTKEVRTKREQYLSKIKCKNINLKII